MNWAVRRNQFALSISINADRLSIGTAHFAVNADRFSVDADQNSVNADHCSINGAVAYHQRCSELCQRRSLLYRCRSFRHWRWLELCGYCSKLRGWESKLHGWCHSIVGWVLILELGCFSVLICKSWDGGQDAFTFHLIGQGSAPDLLVSGNSHATITPNRTLTTYVDNFKAAIYWVLKISKVKQILSFS